MRFPFLLMLMLSLAFAACEGNISYFVPAVVGNEGGLVNVSMSLIPGEGDVYASVYPRTGLSTQESILEAVSYAAKASGRDERCSLIVDFGKSASEIDGPSAGAAMGVMAYALFEGRDMRKDTVITGTIDQAGNVGPVGGLYEKARGAAQMGAKYFITPVESLYEALILRDFKQKYGIEILQARNVKDVIGFMLYGRELDRQDLSAKKRDIPALDEYTDAVAGFGSVAREMIRLESEETASMPDDGEDSEEIRDFFGNEVDRQEGILGKGYAFSAANEAFLNYIDLSTIERILNGSADLGAKKKEARDCLAGLKRPAMTDSNFEWVIGSDLREAWARERLNSTDIDGPFLADESFIVYNELMYAQAWCLVSKEIARAAPAGGNEVDESGWKELATAKIGEAGALDLPDQDSQSKLRSARYSFDHGRYGAAIFDAAYVIAAGEGYDGNDTGALSEKRVSMWGRIYQSHAAFLHSQNQTAAALRTAIFARTLDQAAGQMRKSMVTSAPAAEEPEQQQGQADYSLYYALAAGILFLLVIALIILIRGIYGGRKRPLKAYGTGQKKGRA